MGSGPAGRSRAKHRYHVMIKSGGPICNLDCRYCYYLGKTALYPDKKKFRMSEALLERFIKAYLGSHPGPTVLFPWHGGEPTLLGLDFFRQAVALQRKYLPPGWQCINIPQTNGTLLDEDWCRFFAENGFVVGISLDGPAGFHDAGRPDRRGQPSFERSLRGLRLLRQFGVPFTVLCTVNRHNQDAPLEVYRFFRREGVVSMQFLPIVVPAADGAVSAETVSPAAYGRFLVAIFEEWLRGDVGRISLQIVDECLAKLKGDPGSLCLYREKCGDSMALEHNGDLYACDHFVTPEWKLGNLTERSMASMVESPRMKAFARAKKAGLPACCQACDVKVYCHGGCPKDRILTAPSGEPGLNYLCEGLGHFFRHARDRLTALLAQAGA